MNEELKELLNELRDLRENMEDNAKKLHEITIGIINTL